jgi:uncharacterized membrane protein
VEPQTSPYPQSLKWFIFSPERLRGSYKPLLERREWLVEKGVRGADILSIEFRKKLLEHGSVWLGIGCLGAFDGIVFHQLLQWHSVYMDTHRHGQIVSDGLFHTFTVIALIVGALMLWQAGHPNDIARGKQLLLGGVLMGGGGFNLVEGLVNHHILQIHHVREGVLHELAYDLAFLASGVLLYAIGFYIKKSADDRRLSISR